MDNRKSSQRRRFEVRPVTLRSDRIAAVAFRVGGSAILLMVFGILVFIVVQVFPLFQGAKVKPLHERSVESAGYVLLGVDEWTEFPFLMTRDGDFHFFNLNDASPPHVLRPEALGKASPTAWAYHQDREMAGLALETGECLIQQVAYQPEFDEHGQREGVRVALESVASINSGAEGVIHALDFDQTERQGLLATIESSTGGIRLRVTSYQRKVGLLSAGDWQQADSRDLTLQLSGRPTHVLVGGHADTMLVADDSGVVDVFLRRTGGLELIQSFRPFPDEKIASMDWLAGRRSVVFGSPQGQLKLFSPALEEASGQVAYDLARELQSLPGSPTLFAASVRNRVFLVGSGDSVSLRYGTTGAQLWRDTLPFEPRFGLIGSRYKNLLFLSEDNRLRSFALDDPHPEASFTGFFGKVRYEGQSEDRYIWQSTGGGDDFEPKLSLIPLITGTLKGTLYAMLFAVPVALTAALYSAQFLTARVRRVVKPAMEIMASLPSVVLGFLAALWLAPLIESHIPSVLLGLVFIPLSAVMAGLVWHRLPPRLRDILPQGCEFLPMIPLVVTVFALGWWLGPFAEKLFFTVSDPATGQSVADFRLWWQESLGMQFEQRNALVVGFMMGFAVIPIIFTLSEDAMANVPQSLVSGSLALGAGRWETARRIVLPMALPGIFSALMIGLGRAVGETMIVVMATGNTPLTDFNLFSGMRTLAANIAVELPEAPFQGTLYRTLFLGAMLLFIMTFAVNTLAEITRERIRQRYQSTP